MWELVRAGGWLMVPLLLCSLFTVAICIERFLRLKKMMVIPQALLFQQGQPVEKVFESLQQQPALQNTTLGRIFVAGFQAYQLEVDKQFGRNTQAQMEVVASHEILLLEKNINFLGTLSAVAPLLGLLGTVVGIIESFLIVDIGANSDPSAMIPGISKALITTAVGMLIAIPALFAYRYFQRLVNEYIAVLEQQATLFHAGLFFQDHQAIKAKNSAQAQQNSEVSTS